MGERADAAAPAMDQGEFGVLPLDAIRITGRNTRVHNLDEKSESLQELAASIRENGVLEPVLVRPVRVDGHADSGYELLAGERRVRAAKLAGLSEVPAIVRVLDPKQAATVTTTENLQREDLNALEEAGAVQRLLDSGCNQAQAAAKLGKSERWVRRRVSLLRLGEPWKKEHSDPKSPVSTWPATHLELVARLPADVQERVLKDLKRANWNWRQLATITREDLERRFAELTHALSMAPWKLADAELLPRVGACAACMKRSSCEPMLFDTGASTSKGGRPQKGDRCLDPACWNAKLKTGLKKREAELRAKHAELLLVTDGSSSRADGVLPYYKFTACKKADKGARPALHVEDSQAGKLVWVKKNRSASTSTSSTPRALPLKELRAQLNRKRLAHCLNDVGNGIEQSDWPLQGGEKISGWGERLAFLSRLAAVFGAKSDSYIAEARRWKQLGDAAKWSDKRLCEELWPQVRNAILETGLPSEYNIEPRDTAALKEAAAFVGLQWDVVWAEACVKHPEPEQWKDLKADGTAKPKKTATTKGTKKKPAKKGKKKAS